MWIFVIAGIIYLIGVAIVLYTRPQLMFTPDGQWKEFGIGQSEERYSPFPFWIFCLTWAIGSYILVLVGQTLYERKGVKDKSVHFNDDFDLEDAEFEEMSIPIKSKVNNKGKNLPTGYYVLNKQGSRLAGVPKYVYMGPNEPSNI